MALPRIHAYGSLKLTAKEWGKILGYDHTTINKHLREGKTIEQICTIANVDPFDDEQTNSVTISSHIEVSLAYQRRKAITRLHNDLKKYHPHYLRG